MKVRVILLYFTAILLLSCKEKEKEQKTDEIAELSQSFEVVIEAVVKQDDKIMLYYQDPNIPWFSDEHFVERSIIGFDKKQKIVLSVPEKYVPTNIRLDISSVKGQDPIEIDRIILRFYGKEYVIDKTKFTKYFTPNEYIKLDPKTIVATFSEIPTNQNPYDPIFNSTSLLIKEISKLTTP